MEAKETFKVLVTECGSDAYWYKDSIGEIFAVKDNDKNTFRIPETTKLITKSDCHVIEPAWKVMKDAEETGKKVEVWITFNCQWYTTECWYISDIYRFAPEPEQPEYEPYSYEDRDTLRGLWVRRKNDNAEFLIMAVYSWGVGTNETCSTFRLLFDNYETIDGLPVGKLI